MSKKFDEMIELTKSKVEKTRNEEEYSLISNE